MGKTKKSNPGRFARRAREIRLELIAMLGGRCVGCKCDDPAKLEFDHKNGTTWTVRKKSSHCRMAQYRREAEAGLLQLLCDDCNKAKGEARRHAQWRRELVDSSAEKWCRAGSDGVCFWQDCPKGDAPACPNQGEAP